jgi:hypothetical protein
MEGMDWWFEYFTESRIYWVYCRSWQYIEGNQDLFEEFFSRAEAEMADGIGKHLTVHRDPDGPWRVTYKDVRGKMCSPEVRWWVVRRIRSFARRPNPGPLLAEPPTPESNLSLCTTVAEFFRRIDACLRILTPRELLAMFYEMRFSDHAIDALPDECAPPILSRYGLTDADLHCWCEKNPRNNRFQHRFQGRQRFENCMRQRHGAQWRTYALEG